MAEFNRTTFTVAYEVDRCHLTNLQSLINCAKNPHGDGGRIRMFLYTVQLLFAKELILIPKHSFSPTNFSYPTNESVLGSQYVGEADFAAAQTVLT